MTRAKYMHAAMTLHSTQVPLSKQMYAWMHKIPREFLNHFAKHICMQVTVQ
jgi:hypothetical protein